MKLSEEYDEKQLKDRGIAYQRAYTLALITGSTVLFITYFFEVNMNAFLIFSICLCVPNALLGYELIMKNAYDGLNSHYVKYITSVMLVCGLINVISIFPYSLFKGQPLSEQAASFIFSITCTFIGIVYWYKQYKNRKDFGDE